ncbi:MAG: alpha/beta fold hydrolase [Proteobacteria bacterium]|nr:alpha/beta fold hydrolase [Pseudomonadota bacterium]
MTNVVSAEAGTVGDWPHREASRFVRAGPVRWHVQEFGSGPVLLLIHGTGASTHSWRDLAPLLGDRFRVIVPDLPGHGLTSAPAFRQFSLPAMAAAMGELLQSLEATPAMAVGHSAGAAVAVRMALDGRIRPRVVVSINGALLPLAGLPGWLFSPIARALARSPALTRWMSRRAATVGTIERLVADTGSRLDARGIDLYRQLAQRPEHVAAALAMMANWDLQSLAHDLPRLKVPLVLLTATGDRTIAPEQAQRVHALLPAALTMPLGPLGHLAHEEQPQQVARILLGLAAQYGVQAH